MSRILIAVALVAAAPTAALADDDVSEEVSESAPAADSELGVALGIEGGGRVSPGGLQISGHHLYRLSDVDWLDSSLAFTFGGGGAECFRDRDDNVLCDHGLLDGIAGEGAVGIRRFFADLRQDRFIPYARVALGLRFVRFGADGVNGLAIPALLGGGLRVVITDQLALTAGATLRPGIAIVGRGMGLQPHATLSIDFGVEFALE